MVIGLSRFRSAIVRDPMVKVAYISQSSAKHFEETNQLNVDPGYLGTGCLVESSDDTLQLKIVGIQLEDVLVGSENNRNRAYRWAMHESEPSIFINEEGVMDADDRMLYLLEEMFTNGVYPPIHVWVLDKINENIFSHDESVDPPHGEYREYSFEAIVNYPLVDENNELIKNEYVILVTDL